MLFIRIIQLGVIRSLQLAASDKIWKTISRDTDGFKNFPRHFLAKRTKS